MKPKKIVCETPGIPSPEHRGWLADVADICNSELAQGIGVALMATGVALMILAFTLGIGGCIYLERAGEAEVNKATAKE